MFGSEPSDIADAIKRLDERLTDIELEDTKGSTSAVTESISESALASDSISTTTEAAQSGFEWGTDAWGFDSW